MSQEIAKAGSVWAHRTYALYFVGRIVSILSFQMLVVAIGWQLYVLTGSALDLGFLGLAQFVPMLVLTPLVGHIVDRHDHRHILLVCQVAEATAAAVGAWHAPGSLSPLAMYVIVALVGATRAFRDLPTMVAIIPGLVPRPLVPSATAWFATANQAGGIIGRCWAGCSTRWVPRWSTGSRSGCGRSARPSFYDAHGAGARASSP